MQASAPRPALAAIVVQTVINVELYIKNRRHGSDKVKREVVQRWY